MSEPVTSITSAAAAERRADQLRGELAGTIEQLKDNLRPARLAGEALATTRAHTPDWLVESLAVVRSPSGLALVFGAPAAVASRRTRIRSSDARRARSRPVTLTTVSGRPPEPMRSSGATDQLPSDNGTGAGRAAWPPLPREEPSAGTLAEAVWGTA